MAVYTSPLVSSVLMPRKLTSPKPFASLTTPGVSSATPRTGDQDIILPKIDWVVNQKNHASFEVNRTRWWSPAGIQTQATNSYGTNTFGNDYVSGTWGIARLDTKLSNSITNQFRFQYGRDFEWELNQPASAYDAQTLINPVVPGATTPTGYVNATLRHYWRSAFYIRPGTQSDSRRAGCPTGSFQCKRQQLRLQNSPDPIRSAAAVLKRSWQQP